MRNETKKIIPRLQGMFAMATEREEKFL